MKSVYQEPSIECLSPSSFDGVVDGSVFGRIESLIGFAFCRTIAARNVLVRRSVRMGAR